MNYHEIEYCIKYRVIKLEQDKYILFPVSVEEGEAREFDFKSAKEKIPFIERKNDLKNKYVVDSVYSIDELKIIYDFEEDNYSEDNQKFLCEYFFNDYKNRIIYIETTKNNDVVTKYEIDLNFIKDNQEIITYLYNKDIPSVVLNEDALNQILNCNNLQEIKILLEKYRRLVSEFKNLSERIGISKIKVIDGKVKEIETSKTINSYETNNKRLESNNDLSVFGEISYDGLRTFIKSKVFGHDEEIDTFAQKLYMNYTAIDGEGTDSILLVGPTGTGKTETVNAACTYLDIPSICVNASNIVPQGIKGMSIEDVIISLFDASKGELKKAQKGLIFLDEFDKLNDSDLDIKTAIKNILLTFTAGGIFPIDTEHYNFMFDSSMTNKVFAGVFDRINDTKKITGFEQKNTSKLNLETEQDIRKKIIEKKYFTLEELSRISTVLLFKELDKETKRKILLESKISELSKKRYRYKRQFGIDIQINDDFVEAVLDSVSNSETGMRSVNNIVKKIIDTAEKSILENEKIGYKKLVLTKDTVINPKTFDLN